MLRWLKGNYLRMLERALNHRGVTLLLIGLAVGLTAIVAPQIGAEFMPELDEGNIWVRATFPQQTSLEDAARLVREMRSTMREVPEVTNVLSQLGRPDDGTDPTPTNNCEFFVDLKAGDERGPGRTRQAVVDDLQAKLKNYPGVEFAFSQPIRDNVFEILTGVKGEDSVKLYGTNFRTMEARASDIADVLRTVPGIADVGVYHILGKPTLEITPDREKCKRFGVKVADIQAVIQGVVGVQATTQMIEGEKSFDLIVRLPEAARADPVAIGKIPIEIGNNAAVPSSGTSTPASTGTSATQPAPVGNPTNASGNSFGGMARVPLRDLAEIKVRTGPAMIYRDHHARYIAIRFAVRGRDLAGAVAAAKKEINKKITKTLPGGYYLEWGGEFQQMQEANNRLAIIIPVSLLLILGVLYYAFSSALDTALVLTNVIDLSLGGIWALYLTHTPFSVSAAVGFISIFGVAVQDGVLLVTSFNALCAQGVPVRQAIMQGAEKRLRPVLITSLTAALGLLPAALSTRIGAQTQHPLAVVIVGGMLATIFLTRYLVPVLYSFYGHRRVLTPEPAA